MRTVATIEYDAFMGDPSLPDVPDNTFTPAKPATFLGLLCDFGWLTTEEYETAVTEFS